MQCQDSTPRGAGAPLIPGYLLLERIGEGGMGTVYRAQQLGLNRIVAVKLLPPLPADRPLLRAGGQSESRLMASLAHPHVVALHDCGQVEGRVYLVMEYVEGPNLRALMQPGVAWAAARALPLLDAVASALTHIHDKGILHLDLKPENVLCDARGSVKITDFGLALPQVDARPLAELGRGQGTVDYCPPEQRFGLPVDQRADLFALATLAYELLTGRLPGRVWVPATRREPRLPAGVDAVLRRGLARDPADRFATIAEFRAALRETSP